MRADANVSPWLGDVAERAAPLREDVEADVAVIGAGYAGLNAALALRARGLSVVVLEAQYAGFGASGRNAGHLTPTIGKDLPTLMRVFGRDRAGRLVRFADAAIAHVEGVIERHGIECDYEPVGNIVAAIHPCQYGNLDRAAAAASQYGIPHELLEPEEMQRRGVPACFRRGYFEPHGGILNPGVYVRGLRRAVLEAGAALYEGTPVLSVDCGVSVTLRVAHGCVRAGHVVVATNAYTPGLRMLRHTVLPLYVQLFQTEPLSVAQREAVGWRGRQGVYTAHEMLESYRLTHDGRIVGGAKWVRYGFGGRSLDDWDAPLAALLERVFRMRFPELCDLPVARHWGGPIAFSLDFLPVLRRTGRDGNIVCAVGYAGHGIALASYVGSLAADWLLDRGGPGEVLWDRRIVPLPPEPLRWLVIHGLTGLFGWLDRRVDRRVAAAQ